jgi:hypothetical protein
MFTIYALAFAMAFPALAWSVYKGFLMFIFIVFSTAFIMWALCRFDPDQIYPEQIDVKIDPYSWQGNIVQGTLTNRSDKYLLKTTFLVQVLDCYNVSYAEASDLKCKMIDQQRIHNEQSAASGETIVWRQEVPAILSTTIANNHIMYKKAFVEGVTSNRFWGIRN